MTETTYRRPSGAELRQLRRSWAASDAGLDPTTLKPLPRTPRSTVERAADLADAVPEDLLHLRDRVALAAALAAVSQAESATRTASALESIAEALATLARAAGRAA